MTAAVGIPPNSNRSSPFPLGNKKINKAIFNRIGYAGASVRILEALNSNIFREGSFSLFQRLGLVILALRTNFVYFRGLEERTGSVQTARKGLARCSGETTIGDRVAPVDAWERVSGPNLLVF
jgi:hypothetical protein